MNGERKHRLHRATIGDHSQTKPKQNRPSEPALTNQNKTKQKQYGLVGYTLNLTMVRVRRRNRFLTGSKFSGISNVAR